MTTSVPTIKAGLIGSPGVGKTEFLRYHGYKRDVASDWESVRVLVNELTKDEEQNPLVLSTNVEFVVRNNLPDLPDDIEAIAVFLDVPSFQTFFNDLKIMIKEYSTDIRKRFSHLPTLPILFYITKYDLFEDTYGISDAIVDNICNYYGCQWGGCLSTTKGYHCDYPPKHVKMFCMHTQVTPSP